MPGDSYQPLGSGVAERDAQGGSEGANGFCPRERPEGHGHHEHHDFGEKTISFWGSCVLNFNNITGPAVIVLPLLFQQAGWLLPTLGLLVMWVCSSFAATMLTESMQRIPGNHEFRHRYEYSTLVRHYFGERWYLLAQVGFNAGLTASNILSMVITSQVLDTVVTRVAGATYGVSYAAWPPELVPSTPSTDSHGCSWGLHSISAGGVPQCNTSVISAGYLLAMLVCIPMGYLNLDANMGFQWASMWAQLLCSLQFAYEFVLRITPGNPAYCPGTGPAHTPLIGPDFSQVVGVCVFAFSYVSTIPSWANEKRPGVSINKAVWIPSVVGVALNILLGLLGAWAYSLLDYTVAGAQQHPQPYSGTDDILNLLDGQADPRVFMCAADSGSAAPTAFSVSPLTELCVYIWGIGGYVPGIPILAIMVRYNLQSSGVMGSTAAFLWAVVAPWLFTAFFYQAQALLQFCSWVALLCQGFINLVVPILLYRQALLWYPKDREIATSAALGTKPVGKLPSTGSPLAAGAKGGFFNPLSAGPTWDWLGALLASGAASTGGSYPDPLKERLLPDASAPSQEELPVSLQEGGVLGHQGACPPIVQVKGQAAAGVSHLVSVGVPSAPPGGQVAVVPAAPKAEADTPPEGDVEAVPEWLLLDPVALATSMAWLVTVAVVISIGLSLFT